MNPLCTPGALLLLLARTARAVAREGLSLRSVVREVMDLGNKSVPLVAGGMAFFGMVMITHAAMQGRKVVGDIAVVGPAYFEILVREFGPAVAGLFAAVRIGAAAGAQCAAMSATEQIDAMRLCAAEPLVEVVAPRVAASLIAFPVLALVGTACAGASTALFATFVYDADGWAFLDARFVDAGDLGSAASKAVLFGLFVPLAACRAGLLARPGAGAVGEATTRAVVSACVVAVVLDLVTTLGFHLVGA